MRIYLDTSVYNRPFDDQSQPRIWLETLSFIVILQMVEAGDVELESSSVIEYENSENPFVLRQRWVSHCLQLASHRIQVDNTITMRAELIAAWAIGAMDALHLACAEQSNCDVFITCDDRVIRRYRGPIRVQNPVDFVREVTESEQ